MEVLVVDYTRADAPQRFVESLHTTGFGVLVGHPLDPALIETIYAEWLAFFRTDAKLAYTVKPGEQDGFSPARVSETARGHTRKDLKEFFHIFRGGSYPGEVSDAALRYFDLAAALAGELLQWAQDATPAHVRSRFSVPLPEMIANSPRNLLRVLHYPPLTGAEDPGALRAAPHEDINLLTLLPAASTPGLEVRDAAGRWHQVPCDPGTLIVNTGDMLAEAAPGYYPSTTHRVANPPATGRQQARVSLPFFLHPRDEVVLSGRHTAGSYLAERLRELAR
jgi:isopenicillin N synthase-like dioxygenase